MKEKYNKISRTMERLASKIPDTLKEKTLYKKLKKKNQKMLEKTLNPYFEKSAERLQKMKNMHAGKRCFIVGTGPSLNYTDLSKIKEEFVFGVNSLIKINKKIGINYYVVSDEKFYRKYEDRLDEKIPTFIGSYAARRYISKGNKNNVFPVKNMGKILDEKKISKDISKGTYNGDTVILFAIQIARYMGFEEIYLVGCDSDYSQKHHFDNSKATTDIGMAAGDYSKVFQEYEICKKEVEKEGKKIYNATVGGKLEIFERRKLEEII